MLLKTQSDSAPARVRIENPADRTIIRLADNITEIQTEDGTVYEWDEVEFDAPEDRALTVSSVEEDFDEWWSYGSEEIEIPTLEQRVEDLEEALLALLEEV